MLYKFMYFHYMNKVNIVKYFLEDILNKIQYGTVMKSVGSRYLLSCLGMNYSTMFYLHDLGQMTEPQFLICKMW